MLLELFPRSRVTGLLGGLRSDKMGVLTLAELRCGACLPVVEGEPAGARVNVSVAVPRTSGERAGRGDSGEF